MKIYPAFNPIILSRVSNKSNNLIAPQPGNEMIHELTRDSNQKLVVELTDASGLLRYAMYNTFTIADEADDYRLQVLRTREDGVVGMRFAIAEMIQKKLINLI